MMIIFLAIIFTLFMSFLTYKDGRNGVKFDPSSRFFKSWILGCGLGLLLNIITGFNATAFALVLVYYVASTLVFIITNYVGLRLR